MTNENVITIIKDAVETIEHWSAYVDDYYADKYDLEADLERFNNYLKEAEANEDDFNKRNV